MNTDDNTNTPPEASPQDRPASESPPAAALSAAPESPAPAPAAHPGDTAVRDEGAHAADGPPDPPPPAAAARPRKREDDYVEEPGDDIGNRLPGNRLPDDVGNRRGHQPGRQAPQQGPGGRPKQLAPQPQHRGPNPQGGPGQGARGPNRPAGARGGAPQGPASGPRPGPHAPAHLAPAAQAEGQTADGETTPTALSEAGEGVARAEGVEHVAQVEGAAAAEGVAHVEGTEGAPGVEGEGAPQDGAAGDHPRKRRRRRRRKGGAAGEAPALNADGTPVAPSADGDEAEGDAPDGDDGEQPQPGDGEGPSGEGSSDERRGRRHGKGGPPGRERPAFSIGEEVFGRVSQVSDTAIWVDIAGKAVGLFDRRELLDSETAPIEGDQFIATVASTGVRGGMLMLSRLPLSLEEARKGVEAAAASGESVNGFVTGAVKGGLEVDIGGLRAFAPASHVDLHHGADLGYLVGQRLDFQVTQYAKKGRDIVVSRRKMLDEEAQKLRAEALKKIEPGSVQKAIVRKVVAWGVFMALPEAGGVEGLVHMTDASHDRGARLVDLFRVGEELEVKVLRVDEKGKLWLSRRAVLADPWDAVKEKYSIGSRHKGKIARLQPFGAFIELEPGIDGLCHTVDLSIKPIEHPSEVVKVGDELEVIVASLDVGGHRIALHPAPPAGQEAEPRQKIQIHKPLKVVVSQITEGGLVVRILGVTGRASRGFIPAGHTGTERGSDLRKSFPLGTQLEAKVLEIDPRRGEAKLSIRALKEDTEKQAFQQYRAGVAREAKFGTFADLMKKT